MDFEISSRQNNKQPSEFFFMNQIEGFETKCQG